MRQVTPETVLIAVTQYVSYSVIISKLSHFKSLIMQSTTHEVIKSLMQNHSFITLWKIQACKVTVWQGNAQNFQGPKKNKEGIKCTCKF